MGTIKRGLSEAIGTEGQCSLCERWKTGTAGIEKSRTEITQKRPSIIKMLNLKISLKL